MVSKVTERPATPGLTPVTPKKNKKKRKKTPESPRRIAIYVLSGLLLIYGSTWAPAVMFYYEFHRPLETRRESGQGEWLWIPPVSVPEVPTAGFMARSMAGTVLPLPAGAPQSIRNDGGSIAVRFPAGTVRVTCFPGGFVSSMFADELVKNGVPSPVVGSDAVALREIFLETPDRFSLSWPAERRSRYAARLLCKLLLWKDQPVVRAELATRAGPEATVTLLRNESGETQILMAGERGVWLVRLDPDAPDEWTRSPAPWLHAL